MTDRRRTAAVEAMALGDSIVMVDKLVAIVGARNSSALLMQLRVLRMRYSIG